MIDWARIFRRFDWDEGSSRKSVDKHGVSQEAERVFFNESLLVVEDERHNGPEGRFHALGRTDAERQLHVTFACVITTP